MTREQFISLVESSQKAFRRFLVALCCGDSCLADDIAQESYIKAYLSCDDLKDSEKFNSWINRIGYTTFLNHKRSEKINAGYDEVLYVPAADRADRAFDNQELYKALNQLPAKERTSLLLYYMENYSIKEIAVIQDTSESAIKQHLLRGRNHLRGLLSND